MGRTTHPAISSTAMSLQRHGCFHSPYDLEARYCLKRGMAWIGDQVHVSEMWDDDPPHVITPVETTLATPPDDRMLDTIHM